MSLISRFLRFFFHLLYHPFAWTYDLVAAVVSLGRWQDWIQAVIPFIDGTSVLELGHGPGHLQRILCSRGLFTVGLDESIQMGFLAKRSLLHNGYAKFKLVRGLAQGLPFAAEMFDCVVATFPTEYFVEPQTLSDVWRTLKNRGKFIVLPVAWITGKGLLERLMAWVFRLTGQAPVDPVETISERLRKPFQEAGFQVEIQQVEVKSSLLLIVIAQKGI